MRKSAEIKDVRIDDPQARYVIQIDGVNLVYAEAGRGEPLVVDHRDFDRLKEAMIKRHAPILGQAAARAQQWQGQGGGA